MYEIYLIANTVNDKVYVGQTCQGLRRWNVHKASAARGDKHPLYAAMRKYGVDKFTHQVIAEFPTKLEADKAERLWILLLQASTKGHGYVCSDGGDGRTGPNPELRWQRIHAGRKQMPKGEKNPFYRSEIRTEDIVRLYVDEGKSTPKIAAALGCSKAMVYQRLLRAEVSMRSRSAYVGTFPPRKLSPETCAKMSRNRTGVSINQKNKRLDVNNEHVAALYISGTSMQEIAGKFSCSKRIIRYRLERVGIKITKAKKKS